MLTKTTALVLLAILHASPHKQPRSLPHFTLLLTSNRVACHTSRFSSEATERLATLHASPQKQPSSLPHFTLLEEKQPSSLPHFTLLLRSNRVASHTSRFSSEATEKPGVKMRVYVFKCFTQTQLKYLLERHDLHKVMEYVESILLCMYVCTCMCKGWAIKSGPCTAAFNDLLCYPYSLALY
jgi:hypothetical protein